MEDAIKNYEDVDSWKTVIFLYNAAMKEVGTKLEILNDEFQHVHKYNDKDQDAGEYRKKAQTIRL